MFIAIKKEIDATSLKTLLEAMQHAYSYYIHKYNTDDVPTDEICDLLYEHHGIDIEINFYQFVDYVYYILGFNEIEHSTENLNKLVDFIKVNYETCFKLDGEKEASSSWLDFVHSYFSDVDEDYIDECFNLGKSIK